MLNIRRPMRSRTAATAALLAAAAAALIAHMRFFWFVTDDAFISFVYSRNLAEHGQLVFNLGERVEGYTNFLWTVFLAGWMKLGWQPESSSLFFGAAFAIATFGACAWGSRRARGGDGWSPWDALPALVLAAIPGYACWAAGGLETQMFTFFVTLGSLLYLFPKGGDRLRPAAALAFALAALTRPEGNLFFALACLHRAGALAAARRFIPRRDELLFGAVFLALVVPHLLWRHHYYGWWVPNTFYIKSAGGPGTWQRGGHYLWRFADTFWLHAIAAIAAAGIALGRSPGARRVGVYALLVAAVFCLYVAKVGGDFMGLYRFALPIVPLVALAFSLGVRGLVDRFAARRSWIGAPVAAAWLALYAWHDLSVDRASRVFLGPGASDNGIDTPGYLKWYTDDRAAIGRWFGRYGKPDDYAAVGGAGAQVYYSRMRSLDCFGLSDEYIAHQVPAMSNRPGHEKYAPNEYVLSKHPTIITSNRYEIGPAPLVREDAAYWRAHGYHYVAAQVPGLSSPWYSFLKRIDRPFGPLPAEDELQ
jgi:hypothetical protein